MSEPSTILPCRFSFTYSEEEIKAYSRVVAARQDRGPDTGNFFAAMMGLILGLGLIVGLARYQGWIAQAALKPVLISTYASFILGAAAYAFAIHLGYRRIARRYRERRKGYSCEIGFDADGITYKDDRYDIRVPWRAVEDIRDADSLVAIWVGLRDGFILPQRVFADTVAREAFVAAARECVSAAKTDRSAG